MDRTLSIGTINRKLENRKSDLKYFLTNGIPVDDLLKDISKLESLQKQMVSKPKSKSKSKTVSRTNNYHNQINNLKGCGFRKQNKATLKFITRQIKKVFLEGSHAVRELKQELNKTIEKFEKYSSYNEYIKNLNNIKKEITELEGEMGGLSKKKTKKRSKKRSSRRKR